MNHDSIHDLTRPGSSTPGGHSASTPAEEGPPHLDADLRGLASGLDALGRAEGAGAPRGLEQRVLGCVLTELRSVAPVAAAVDALGARDRGAAADGIERRVHGASRSALRPGLAPRLAPGLRLAGQGRAAPAPRGAWFAGARLAAAAVLLLAGAAATMLSLRSPSVGSGRDGGVARGPATDHGLRLARLDAEVQSEMDRLFNAMSESGAAETAGARPTSEVSTDEIVDWLNQGASS